MLCGCVPSHESYSATGPTTVAPTNLSELVDDIEARIERRLRQSNASQDRSVNLRKLLNSESDWLASSEIHQEAVRRAYEEAGYAPRLTTPDALTEAGIELAETIIHSQNHGLDPEQLHAPQISALINDLRESSGSTTPGFPAEFNAEHRDRLEVWLHEQSADDGVLPSPPDIAHLIASDDRRNPLPEFAPLSHGGELRASSTQSTSLRLELLLADAFVRFGKALRFDNPGYYYSEATEQGWNLENPATAETIGTKLGSGALAKLLISGDAETAVQNTYPPFEQYDRLLEGVAEYQRYVQDGGWSEYEITREMRAGRSYDEVPVLRKRLAAEDYWSGDLESRHYDEALEDAVLHYQTTHQLRLHGDVDEYTLTSLNVPAERRLAQTYQALRRYHDTRLARTWQRDYILVNLPDFHAELWDGSERVYRWVTIVGKLKRQRDDETGELRYWGATPLFSDEMEHIVFNPYWNVPGNIWKNEYADKIEEDPEYLEEHNFEILVNDHGNEFLRQKPGPDNALGLVKFLFPNEHDVYLHDTNRPRLFRYNIRAFSHGCIRVSDALELAAILLSRDRQQSKSRSQEFIREMLEKGDEQWVGLRNHLPIHFEYFAVRGGDEGKLHFLADVYRLDRAHVDALEESVRGRANRFAEEAEAHFDTAQQNYQRQRFEARHRDTQSSLTPREHGRSAGFAARENAANTASAVD
jgi:murein L,D-transpeptidase YcbB/YkuD